MKLPRDLSGVELAKTLQRVGYHVTRGTGSHLRMTIDTPAQHHVTIPADGPLKVGTSPRSLATWQRTSSLTAMNFCADYSVELNCRVTLR